MASALFEKGVQGFLGDGFNWGTQKNKAILVDMNDAGPAAGAYVITAVSNVVNPTITTSAAHGLVAGDKISIGGVGGATGVNGLWDVLAAPTTTTITITTAAPGVYTSGGFLANLMLQFLSEFVVAGGRVATSAALGTKTSTNGVADAADVTFTAVTGDPSEALIIVRAAVLDADADLADTAQRLIAFIDTATGLPVTPSGSNIDVTWSNGADKIFRL